MTEYCNGSRDHRHDWTEWGHFVPEPLEWTVNIATGIDVIPENVGVAAKRERLCRNCRGVQREEFRTGKRSIHYPGNDGY